MLQRALERKAAGRERLDGLKANFATLEDQVESLKTSQATLHHKIELFQGKKEDMYGQGQLSDEVFAAFKPLAEQGTLRQVQVRLAQLEEAREVSSRILADLKARMAGLAEAATGMEQAARELMATDEPPARRLLMEKVELEASRERLADQVQALRVSRLCQRAPTSP